MANNNTYNVASFILIFAALLGILSFFCGWFQYSSEGASAGWTGYGILDNTARDIFGGVAFVPLLVLIISVLALIVAFLPKMGLNVSAPKYSLMLLILGFAIIILTIIFTISNVTFTFEGVELPTQHIWENLGVGAWFAYIGAVLMIFVAALPALTRKV